jgi:putative membrane protein
MLQHLLMIVVIPPLLLLGLPADLVRRIVAWRPARIVATASSNGPAAWLLAVTTLYVWHVPVLYDAALHSEPLHILEHLCFLVTATIFWWPVLAPLPEYRLPVASAIIYLFAASIANDALGIAITFAAPGLYPTYLRPDNAQGILTLLRDNLGISASQDQQAAGILMWIPSNLPFLVAIMGLLIRWFGEPEPDIAQVNGPAGAR